MEWSGHDKNNYGKSSVSVTLNSENKGAGVIAHSSRHTCTDTGRIRRLLSVSSHGVQDSWPWGLPSWPARRGGGGEGVGKAEAWAGPLGDRTPVRKAWTGAWNGCVTVGCHRLSATDVQVDDVRG